MTADPGGLVVGVDAQSSLRDKGGVVVRGRGGVGSGGGAGSLRRPSCAGGGVTLDSDLGVELDGAT